MKCFDCKYFARHTFAISKAKDGICCNPNQPKDYYVKSRFYCAYFEGIIHQVVHIYCPKCEGVIGINNRGDIALSGCDCFVLENGERIVCDCDRNKYNPVGGN